MVFGEETGAMVMEFFELTQRDIDEALAEDADVHEAKIELANRAAEYWRSIYPVEQDDRLNPPRPPGTGRDSIHVVTRGKAVSVVCDDPIGHIIEYGSAQVPEFACRARTEVYINNGEQVSGGHSVAGRSQHLVLKSSNVRYKGKRRD